MRCRTVGLPCAFNHNCPEAAVTGQAVLHIQRASLQRCKSVSQSPCIRTIRDFIAITCQDLPKSMRLTVAPGQYNPITSDFEQAKIKILRQKKIASRSGWAQNISFTSTERRFHTLEKPVGPPPGAYTPKTNLADHIAKQNVRAGPFGTTSNVSS